VSPPSRADKFLQSNFPRDPDLYETPSDSPLPPKATRNLKLPSFPPTSQSLDGPKYDIRSARGGRGGVVTSVAALWASIQTTEGDAASPTVVPAKSTSPPNPVAPVPARTRPSETPWTKYQQSPLNSRPNRVTKSLADPAAVNGTLARPYLSSTASLARPVKPAGAPASPKPEVQPNAKRTGPLTNEQQGLGQARLRDLINKYQNQHT